VDAGARNRTIRKSGGAYFAPQVSVVKVSKRFQERQQLIARPESLESGADRSDLCERLSSSHGCLGSGSWLRRTEHPFAVSSPRGPSQKIECVFSASPATIRREPRELISVAQSATAGLGSLRAVGCCCFFAWRLRFLGRRAPWMRKRYEVAFCPIHGEHIRHHFLMTL
jgi:hypothetical protein